MTSYIINGLNDPDIHTEHAKTTEGVFLLALAPDSNTAFFAYNPDARTWQQEDGSNHTPQSWYDLYGAQAREAVTRELYLNFQPEQGDYATVEAILAQPNCVISSVWGEAINYDPSPIDVGFSFTAAVERQANPLIPDMYALPFVSLLDADDDTYVASVEDREGIYLMEIDHDEKLISAALNPPRENLQGLHPTQWFVAVKSDIIAVIQDRFLNELDAGDNEELLDAILEDYFVMPVLIWTENAYE